jgi:CxxC-x17-CxxC domain-containing protein
MHQGNWTCSGCGKAITELPFEPRSENGLMCRECHAKARAAAAGADATTTDENGAPAPKPKVAGNWVCSMCGAAITSLPFTPRDTSNLKCMDCFKKSKA